MTDQPLFELPEERELLIPAEWVTTTGRISWRREKHDRCDDCMHVIAQHLDGAAFDRSPGLAKKADWTRTQQRQQTYHCDGHAAERKARDA